MNVLNPIFAMPEILVQMLDHLIKEKEDGEYRISLNNTDYDIDGGVRPYLIEVAKEDGHYSLLTLSNFHFKGADFVEATQFDFVKRTGFVENGFSFNFDDMPDINEALEANAIEMVMYFDTGFFDLPVVVKI